MDTRLDEREEAQIYLKQTHEGIWVSDPLQMSDKMNKLHKCHKAFSQCTLTELLH